MVRSSNQDGSSQQPVISSFFLQIPSPKKTTSKPRKRTDSPIDLTLDDSEEHPSPRKKSRTNATVASPSAIAGPSRSVNTNHADQWRFESASPEKPVPQKKIRTPGEKAARKKNHEAFKRKLLGENSIFTRKSRELSTAEITGVCQPKSNESNEGSGSDSDGAFTTLQEQFSNKSKGKSKSGNSTFSRRKVKELGPSGEPWTPLEQQILALKKDNPGVLLMVEVGYKIKFFDEDAKIASTELGIACFQNRNFMEAMVPVHRRDVHLKKLLSTGHKVGLVEQIETAALKAIGDNRNQPFERKLTHLYTAATYVDELDSVDDTERYEAPPLLTLLEEQRGGMGADERVSISMISICPSTGDVVYDEFDDSSMRIELETRMTHIKPAELLLPTKGLSKTTEKILTHFTKYATGGARIRIEKYSKAMTYSDAFTFVSIFYTDKTKSAVASENYRSGELMAAIADFPKRVVIVLAAAIKHLSAYGIADALLETKFFSKFTTRTHMLLNANTLNNLEIYRNETDFTSKGSLMWILDKTTTKFGARLLKSWVGRPLIDKNVLKDRVDAVEEIITSPSEQLHKLRTVLRKLPDLAKGLCRIQYGKCTPQELAILLVAFNKVALAFDSFDTRADVGFKSSVLNDIIFSLSVLKQPMKDLINEVSLKKAAEGRKDTMWINPEKYPQIADIDLAIQTVEVELMDELKSIRKAINKPSLQYTTWNGEEYVVEVKILENRDIPSTWHLVSKTKSVARYHTPEVKRKLQERLQCQEALGAASRQAFSLFLREISQNYYVNLRNAVNSLAKADCLLSLAHVALQDGYVRPEFTDDDTLEIVEGRHPIVEALRSDPFIPNTVKMGGREARCKVITGPNMGGKSSSVRMIALIAIMAQIGSYIPADSVKLGMMDGILTRMGASDELARGRSTFMVEMSETSEILRTATKNSLVILDELGRGTSTVDGMAVASAVLQHLLQVTKCKTLFITHYPSVARDLERQFPQDLQNFHMGFTEDTRIDGTREITFLYRLTSGFARKSFGIECARLAGVPEDILTVATERSTSMQSTVEHHSKINRARRCAILVGQCVNQPNVDWRRAVDQLRTLFESITQN